MGRIRRAMRWLRAVGAAGLVSGVFGSARASATFIGAAVGSNGTIVHTVNGSTWTVQTSGTTNLLNGVVFTDALNGWASGNFGTMLHTSNGGNTWTAQTNGISN